MEEAYFASRAHKLPNLNDVALAFNRSKRAAALAATTRGGATSWIDQDDSGTYDPKLGRKTPPPIKTYNAKRLDEDGEVPEGAEKFRKPKGYADVIQISFTSKAALDYLRSITPGPEEIPVRYRPVPTKSGHESIKEIAGEPLHEQRHSTRSRKRIRPMHDPVDNSEISAGAGTISSHSDPAEAWRNVNKNREFLACNQCRQAGLRCSLKNKSQHGPCTNCRKFNGICLFVFRHSSERRRNLPADVTPQSRVLGIKSISRTKKSLQAGQAITDSRPLIYRTTAYSHPIHFNCEPEGCEFHTNPFYGLQGHTHQRQVSGYWLPDGAGFYVENDPENADFGTLTRTTNICRQCTGDRVDIMACIYHQMTKLTGQEQDPRLFFTKEWDRALYGLARADILGDGKLIWNALFCSICPSVAEFRCATGCVLLLCGACCDLMSSIRLRIDKNAEIGNGTMDDDLILDYMVKEINDKPFKYAHGVRADVDFLITTGELQLRMKNGLVGENNDGALSSHHSIECSENTHRSSELISSARNTTYPPISRSSSFVSQSRSNSTTNSSFRSSGSDRTAASSMTTTSCSEPSSPPLDRRQHHQHPARQNKASSVARNLDVQCSQITRSADSHGTYNILQPARQEPAALDTIYTEPGRSYHQTSCQGANSKLPNPSKSAQAPRSHRSIFGNSNTTAQGGALGPSVSSDSAPVRIDSSKTTESSRKAWWDD